jgi:hypothetical protein
MLEVKRIGDNDHHHVELIQQDNELSTVSPGEVEIVVTCAGGPPLIAVPDVVQVTADLAGLVP